MTVFATAGNSASFKNKKLAFPHDLPAYLEGFGLNGYEVQCGHSVNVSSATREYLPILAKKHNLRISLHTPYFISLSSVEEETRQKSIRYILQSAEAAKQIGAERIIVHSGSCAKMSREEALALALGTLKKARSELDKQGFKDIVICPETMGKINQLGTLEEVLELCAFDERMFPCVDFGHLNARTHGEIKSKSDYAAVFDAVADKLGRERLQRLHIHFSKIEFTAGGEKTHLTFADKQFGPDYKPMLEEIYRRGLNPFIVCESQGTQAEDCAEMAEYYKSIIKN